MKTGGHVEAGYQVQKPGCAGVNYKFLFLFVCCEDVIIFRERTVRWGFLVLSLSSLVVSADAVTQKFL